MPKKSIVDGLRRKRVLSYHELCELKFVLCDRFGPVEGSSSYRIATCPGLNLEAIEVFGVNLKLIYLWLISENSARASNQLWVM